MQSGLPVPMCLDNYLSANWPLIHMCGWLVHFDVIMFEGELKVIGQSSRSCEKNAAKVVCMTSSESYLFSRVHIFQPQGNITDK